jgi:hypothetical protein
MDKQNRKSILKFPGIPSSGQKGDSSLQPKNKAPFLTFGPILISKLALIILGFCIFIAHGSHAWALSQDEIRGGILKYISDSSNPTIEESKLLAEMKTLATEISKQNAGNFNQSVAFIRDLFENESDSGQKALEKLAYGIRSIDSDLQPPKEPLIAAMDGALLAVSLLFVFDLIDKHAHISSWVSSKFRGSSRSGPQPGDLQTWTPKRCELTLEAGIKSVHPKMKDRIKKIYGIWGRDPKNYLLASAIGGFLGITIPFISELGEQKIDPSEAILATKLFHLVSLSLAACSLRTDVEGAIVSASNRMTSCPDPARLDQFKGTYDILYAKLTEHQERWKDVGEFEIPQELWNKLPIDDTLGEHPKLSACLPKSGKINISYTTIGKDLSIVRNRLNMCP